MGETDVYQRRKVMKKIMVLLTAFLLALTLGLIGGSPAKDASLQLSVVPADAQWAFYVDMPRLTSSAMFKALVDEGEMAKVKGKTDPFFAKLRVDPLKDLKGVTVFGLGKEDEDAVVALSGKFDRAHLTSLVKAETSHKEIPFGNYTIYSWEDDEFGAFAADDLIILGENEQAIKSALTAMEGKKRDAAPTILAAALKKSPDAFMVFGVNSIPALLGEHDGPVILTKMKSAGGSLTEIGENLKLELNILSESAQVAKDVEQAIRGLIAIANLQLQAEEAKAFAEAVKIAVDGERVQIDAAYPLNKLFHLLRGKAKELSFF
jgi:hypothetical protein